MQPKNLRILPLLIFVAMLSFSVRLADVVSGVSNMSGSAMAETEEEMEEAGEGEAPAQQGGLVFMEDDTAEEAEEAQPEPVPDSLADIEPPEWQDPNDLDASYTTMKMELFDDLAERRRELDGWEKELKTREALIRAAKKELDQKYQELSQLRLEIEKLLEKQSEEEKARVASLVKIYENMKAKDAARIFNTLDLDVLVSVMSRMSERKLSPILAEMNPERARTVTIMLAEQKQLPSLPGTN